MPRARLFLAFAVLGCGAMTPPAPLDPRLGQLDWLDGSWATAGGTTERWWREAGALRGEGTSLRACPQDAPAGCRPERVVTETLTIEARQEGLVYVATPVDQERTEFAIVEASRAGFVAENPGHDFPSRIEYRVEGGAIHAIVSGRDGGFDLVLEPGGP